MISLGQQKVRDEDDTATEDDDEHIDKQSCHEDDSDIDGVMEGEDVPSEDDFHKEADIARKVLNNLIASSAKGPSINNDSMCSEENKEPKSIEIVKDADSKASNESEKVSGVSKPETSSRSKSSNPKQSEDEDLQRTVFISNLPFECDNEEVKQRFSGFGEVEYFVPVLHQVTKYVPEHYFMCVCISQNIIHCPLLLNAGDHEGLVFLSLKPRKQLIMQFQQPVQLLGWVFY